MTLSLAHALSLSLCLPWCRHIINISVMLSHSAGWFITYFCVSACSLIVPLHLSLCLSLSYLMCLHTLCLSPSPCPSVCLLASSYCLAVVFTALDSSPLCLCPRIPSFFQISFNIRPSLPLKTFCHTELVCLRSSSESVCSPVIHLSFSYTFSCHRVPSAIPTPLFLCVLFDVSFLLLFLLASFHWAVSHLSIRLPLSLSLSFSLAFSLSHPLPPFLPSLASFLFTVSSLSH